MRHLPSGNGRLRRAAAAVSVLSIVSLLALAAGSSQGTRGLAQSAAGRMSVTSSADALRAKIHPLLLDQMEATPDAQVLVHVYARAGTDLSRFLERGVPRGFVDPAGNTTATGWVKAANVIKLASPEQVFAVMPATGAYSPSVDDPSQLKRGWNVSPEVRERMTAHLQSGVKSNEAGNPGIGANGWYDVLNTHQAQLAWEKGYTGEGVKVMVNDSGIDFAHPDLMGTEARVTDPSSPYYGWAEQFDQLSMFLQATDTVFGTDLIASGQGYYSDTSTVITEADASFQPLDAAEPYEYTLTGTSLSGNYHAGTHPDNSLRAWYRLFNDLDLEDPEIADERPAVLVVDENEAGVYDTVYVDLNFNHDFSDEKALTKGDDIAGADYWGEFDAATGEFSPTPDGLYDQSGGLMYWISDGVNPVPASDWWYGDFMGIAGNGVADPGEVANGNLVLWSVVDWVTSPAGNHGTLCASNVAAQGVIDSDAFDFVTEGEQAGGSVPSYKPEGTGMVVGSGKDVKLVSAGDFYSFGGFIDAVAFAALGYDGIPGTGDDIQVMSNSWGSTVEHADGWDINSRLIDFVNRLLNPNMLIVFSSGNDGPGFNSMSGPAPESALQVGASTEFGSTNWDSLASADQILYGDAAAFSSRGPTARGTAGIDVMANGARAGGNVPLNEAFSGTHAWTTWGGTSRSAPVAAANAALMFQAYWEAHGEWPTYDVAKAIMKSSATDGHYDPFVQGSGMVNANRAVDIASGAAGFYVTPDHWAGGDYQGNTWPGFANILTPGQSSEGTFTLNNPSAQNLNLTIGDRWLQNMNASWQTDWTSPPVSEEPVGIVEGDPNATEYDWNMPMYLWEVTDLIPENTDVMVYRFRFPFEQLDPAQTYDWQQVNSWQALVYDWTDVNGDGNLWEDANGNGIVEDGELDAGEYNRFDYTRPFGNNGEITIQRPQDRHHDGVFIGLQHRQVRPDVPQTDLTLGLDFYQQVDWGWLDADDVVTVPAGGSLDVEVELSVPGNAAPGTYEGGIWVSDGYWTSIVPVVANVAARNYNVEAGEDAQNSYYDNSTVRGMLDWSGNSVVGDYRQYFTDLSVDPARLGERLMGGTKYFIADVTWENLPTDVNVHLLGPTLDQLSVDDPEYFGPYTLQILGESNRGAIGTTGAHLVQTSSGQAREVVAAPHVPGLNEIIVHNVNYDGYETVDDIAVRAGILAVSHSPITASRPSSAPDYRAEVSMISTLPLSGLVAEGFGLGLPDVRTDVPINQDDPNDPFTATFQQRITLDHAGVLDVVVDGQDTDDLDLFVVYDFDGNGEFDASEFVALSATGSADERVTITFPADGDYLILVHGWAVPAGSSTFNYSLTAVQGDDITVTGLPEGEIIPGRKYTFEVQVDGDGLAPGVYQGIVTLGPPEGPGAVQVPVQFEVRE